MYVTSSRVFNNEIEKNVARILRRDFSIFTKWKTRKNNNVFSAIYGKYMLPDSLVTCSGRVVPVTFSFSKIVIVRRQGT